MRAITEILCDLLHNKNNLLTHPDAYKDFINEFSDFVMELYEPKIHEAFISSALNTLNMMKFTPTERNIEVLIKLIQSFENRDVPMSQQTWYINKMNEIGYGVSTLGQCYGMSNMALSAFLAEDYPTFDARLKKIYNVSTLDIKKNLQAQEKIHPQYLDILAFFDAVAVYQQPFQYPQLFDSPVTALNAELSSRVTSATYYEKQPQKKPTLIQMIAGSYTPHELVESINLLKNYFHPCLFSLILIANEHAITLNYHPEHQWMLVDPNRLPGELYLRTDLLVDAIFKAFFILRINGHFNPSLLMTSCLYTQQKNQRRFERQWNNLKNEVAWMSIHTPHKENLNQLLLLSCTSDDLNMIQDLLDQDITITDQIFLVCCQKGSIQAASLLLRTGFNPTQTLLEQIVFSDKHCPLTWGNWLCTLGLIPPISLLKNALLDHVDTGMANALIDMGIVLTDTFFHDVCLRSHSLEPIIFLMKKGLKPDQTLLYKLCERGDIVLAQFLMNEGVVPTEAMLTSACRRKDYNMVNVLLGRDVQLTLSALDDVFKMEDAHLESLVIACHVELLAWVNFINSAPLYQVINNKQSALIIYSLGDTTYLSLLQHSKRNGTLISYYSLEYACWSNKPDSIRWLLKEGVVLPMNVFNSLRHTFKENVLELLNPNHPKKRTRYCHQPYLLCNGTTLFALPNRQPTASDTVTPIRSTFAMAHE